MDAWTATVLCGLGIVVGLLGIIIPVLPGLILIVASVLLWACVVVDPVGWTVLGIAVGVAVAGWVLQYVVAGRRLRRAGVRPATSVAGIVGAVLGLIFIPVVGLPVGFVAGVLVAELVRRHSFAAAWPPAKAAILAALASFGVELTAGMIIALTWAVGAWRVMGS